MPKASPKLDPATLRWCATQLATHAATLTSLANDPGCGSAEDMDRWLGIASSNQRLAKLFRANARRVVRIERAAKRKGAR